MVRWFMVVAIAAGSIACSEKSPEAQASSTLEAEIEMAIRWTHLPEPRHRAAAFTILGQLATAPIDPETRARLSALVAKAIEHETDGAVVASAVEMLAVLEPEGHVDRLLALAASGTPSARRAAVGPLAKSVTPAHGVRVAALLGASFTDPVLAERRMDLISAVQQAPHPDAAPHLELALALVTSGWHREKIGQAIAQVGGTPADLSAALDQLDDDAQSPYGRIALVTALAAAGDHQATEAIVRQLDSQHESLRVAAIQALGVLRDPGAAGALIRRYKLARKDGEEARALSSVLRGFPNVRWPRRTVVELESSPGPGPQLVAD